MFKQVIWLIVATNELSYFDFSCNFHVHDILLFEQQCLAWAGSSPVHSGINVNISESCGYRKEPVLNPGASQNLSFKELLQATLWHSVHTLLCILFIQVDQTLFPLWNSPLNLSALSLGSLQLSLWCDTSLWTFYITASRAQHSANYEKQMNWKKH